MKEKRVDVYLAKGGFYQVMFYGFGGAFLTELVQYPSADIRVLIISAPVTLALAVTVYRFHNRATRLTNRKK